MNQNVGAMNVIPSKSKKGLSLNAKIVVFRDVYHVSKVIQFFVVVVIVTDYFVKSVLKRVIWSNVITVQLDSVIHVGIVYPHDI